MLLFSSQCPNLCKIKKAARFKEAAFKIEGQQLFAEFEQLIAGRDLDHLVFGVLIVATVVHFVKSEVVTCIDC